MRERVARPRRSSALSCVFAAVLALALAGSACALSVDIVVPEANPAEVAQYEEVRFEAVCRDSRGNDVTEKASFLWTFTETERPAAGNPVSHRFRDAGKFTVTVNATVDEDSGSDQATVVVLAHELLRAEPDAGDFELFARVPGGARLGTEVADSVEIVCRSLSPGALPFLPYEWNKTEFYRKVDDQWVLYGENTAAIYEVGDNLSSRITWHTVGEANAAVEWKAVLYLYDEMQWPPATLILNKTGFWTPNNTIVKATGDEIILHDAEDTSHTIAWNITHSDDVEPEPEFIVTVIIYDLQGNVVDTLQEEEVGLGAGSLDWDEDLPAQDGIYTYKIIATHQDMLPPMGPCEDLDKSPRLTISNVSVSDFEWIDLPTAAQVTLGYQLNRASANCRLRVFNHELDEVTVTAPAGGALSNTVGTHSLTVEFEDPDQIVGNYSFVVLADETANDGALNRDEQPKPAVQKGSELTVLPPAFNFYGDGEGATQAAAFCGVIANHQTNPEWSPPPYAAEPPSQPSGAEAVYQRWEAQSLDTSSDAVIAYVGHGDYGWLEGNGPPAEHDFTHLSLSGVSGSNHLRGGRPADSPENDPYANVYYICNLSAGALQHVRLVTLSACHSAHHTAPEEDWSVLENEETDPSSCGCAAHAVLAKGAQCVVGFRDEICSIGQEWGTLLWARLNQYPVGVQFAASQADNDISAVMRDRLGMDEAERAAVLATIQDRFIGGDVFVTVRPARWAGQ